MGGGILQLEAIGSENLVFMGNPEVSFFKKTFKRYSNFGIEKLILNSNQSTDINLDSETLLTYDIARYGDLVSDMYFSINLPNIWSPIYSNNDQNYPNNHRLNSNYITEEKSIQDWSLPYEFKWIKNIGAHIIKNIKIKIDNQIIQDYSGDYILSIADRDLSQEKKDLFDKMIGNTKKLNDPANYLNRNGKYPNACYVSENIINNFNNINNLNKVGLEPSIREEQLFIPLNNWSMLESSQAIPLVAMQSSKVTVEITLRPVREWYIIRNIRDQIEILKTKIDLCNLSLPKPYTDIYKYFDDFLSRKWVAPDLSSIYDQFYLFLVEPPISNNNISNGTINPLDEKVKKHYYPYAVNWSANPKLIVNYIQLDNLERNFFATSCPSYVINQIFETEYFNLFGNNSINIHSIGLLKCWQWFFRRSDVNLRNEWNNYTNYEYENIDSGLNSPTLIFLEILKSRLINAGNLTNLIENEPEIFSIIYYYAIIEPMSNNNNPIISLFNPPFLFGYGSGDSKISDLAAFEFHAKVNSVNGESLKYLHNWTLDSRGANFSNAKNLTPGTLSGARINNKVTVEYFEGLFKKVVNNSDVIYGLLEINNLIPIPLKKINDTDELYFFDLFGVIDYLITIELINDLPYIKIYKKCSIEDYVFPDDENLIFEIPKYVEIKCICFKEIIGIRPKLKFFKTKSNSSILFVIDNTKIFRSDDYGITWNYYDFSLEIDNLLDITPNIDLSSIYVVYAKEENLILEEISYTIDNCEYCNNITVSEFSNFNYDNIELFVAYNNNIILKSNNDIRFFNQSLLGNTNPLVVSQERGNNIEYYFNVEYYLNEFDSNDLEINNLCFSNDSNILYLLLLDKKNNKYYILISIDYGQKFVIYNIFNDDNKEIYKIFSIDVNLNSVIDLHIFETNYAGDILLVGGNEFLKKFYNYMNNKIDLKENIEYSINNFNSNLKFNRDLVYLNEEPFFVYYEDNFNYDNNFYKKFVDLFSDSSNKNNNIQKDIIKIIDTLINFNANVNNSNLKKLIEQIKEILNNILSLSDNNNLENILYILLEREPVIRNYNTYFKQIESYKSKNTDIFELFSKVIINTTNLDLESFYKDILTGLLQLRENNLALKELIVMLNLELFLKLNIQEVIYNYYYTFTEQVDSYNVNMKKLNEKIKRLDLLEKYLTVDEINRFNSNVSSISNRIILYINFLTKESESGIPIVILLSSNRFFYNNISKVNGIITKNLNYRSKIFTGTSYSNIFKNVTSLPNKNMINNPIKSSRDFMLSSPIFWFVGDVDFPQKISDLLFFNNNSVPTEWTNLTNTDYSWQGNGNSFLSNLCNDNNINEIYDLKPGNNIPNWTEENNEIDYWLEERDANGIYEELLFKWDIIASSIFLKEKECPITGNINNVSVTKEQPQLLKNIMLEWGFYVDNTVRERERNQLVSKYMDTYSNMDNGIIKDGLYFYNFALKSSIYNSQPSGTFNSSYFNQIDWNFTILNPDYNLNQIPITVVCNSDNSTIESQQQNPNLTLTNIYRNYKYTFTLKIMEERYNILTTKDGVGRLVLSN